MSICLVTLLLFFYLEKQRKFSIFRVFLPLGDALLVTFNETHAPTSRLYAAEQGIAMINLSKIFQNFWLNFSIFALERQPKNLNFQSSLASRRPLICYFQ